MSVHNNNSEVLEHRPDLPSFHVKVDTAMGGTGDTPLTYESSLTGQISVPGGIPGKGKVTRDPDEWPMNSCGSVRFRISCSVEPSHAKWGRLAFNHCDHMSCPACWHYWKKKEAERGAARPEGYFDVMMKVSTTGRAYRPRHWTLSPPPWKVDEILMKAKDPGHFLDLLREAAREVFDNSSLQGAEVIYHPYRLKKGEDSPNRWNYIRDLENWRDYVIFSPHFHLIAFGYVPNTKDFFQENGWVLKEIRKLETKEKTLDLLNYLLSHVAVIPGKKIVTYWGCLSSRYLIKISEKVSHEDELCPECGAPMMMYDIGIRGELIGTGKVPQVYHIERRYEIRDPGGT